MRIRFLLALVLVWLGAVSLSCQGTTDGSSGASGSEGESGEGTGIATPSGPEEIPGPTALRFPSSVTIGVDTIQLSNSGHSSLALKDMVAALGASGEFSDEIDESGQVATAIQGEIDQVFSSTGILGGIEVEIGDTVVNFTSTVQSASQDFAGEELKIDFAKFTSSKSETEACSGSTKGDLICYRVWVSGDRLLAGFFSTLPTDTQEGAGQFWFKSGEKLTAGHELPAEADQVSVDWDHTDTAGKKTEINTGEISGGPSDGSLRIIITQSGAEESTSIKTVEERDLTPNRGSGKAKGYQSISRWKEDEDFWSGKFIHTVVNLSTGKEEDKGNSNVCARLSTGNAVVDSFCQSIDTDSEDFIDPASEEDFTFPSDFPETPTF